MKFINTALRKFLTVVARTLFHLYFRVQVEGAENLQKVQGAVVCSNHKNAFDPVILMLATKKRYIYLLGKQALCKNRLSRWFLCDVLLMNTVGHNGGDIAAIKWSVTKLRQGNLVGIFPEGTRNRTQALLLPFEEGAALIACMAKVPVIPVSIKTTYKLWSRCKIVYGEPLFFEEYYKGRPDAEAKRAITQEIRENIEKNLKK